MNRRKSIFDYLPNSDKIATNESESSEEEKTKKPQIKVERRKSIFDYLPNDDANKTASDTETNSESEEKEKKNQMRKRKVSISDNVTEKSKNSIITFITCTVNEENFISTIKLMCK